MLQVVLFATRYTYLVLARRRSTLTQFSIIVKRRISLSSYCSQLARLPSGIKSFVFSLLRLTRFDLVRGTKIFLTGSPPSFLLRVTQKRSVPSIIEKPHRRL